MSKIILGISDSHEAHACILKDGVVVAAIAQERLTRLKSDMGFPSQAIDACFRIAKISPSDVDVVAVAGLSGNLFKAVYKLNALFSVDDWIRQCYSVWKPALLEGGQFSHFDDFEKCAYVRQDIENDPYYPLIGILKNLPQDEWFKAGQNFRSELISERLGIESDKVHFFRHEDCHKAYGVLSNPSMFESSLVFTLEGGGDDSSATVSTVTSDLKITEHWSSNEPSIGRLYRYVTLILGMQPGQHEYKVMGLAPYGTEYHGQKALEIFRKVNFVEDEIIKNPRFFPDLYFSLKDALEGIRFDGIAWAIQAYTEEILCQWVQNNVRSRYLPNVILSGGVAQNIKACKAVIELDEVERLWVGPISGDGSLGLGAAWLANKQKLKSENAGRLSSIYTGTSYSNNEVQKAIQKFKLSENFYVYSGFCDADIATWLEQGNIIGRFSGRMEFGQRALGNRSIIADPRVYESVEKINKKIKYRDFWMPFTPSMTVEEAARILENPKSIYSPYMTLAFDLKREFSSSIPAAQHPADKTVRPQMLSRLDNPKYFDLLNAFKKRTGLAVLLNTSFNLHGDAIVETPAQAIQTFLDCDMDILLFDSTAVSRHSLSQV